MNTPLIDLIDQFLAETGMSPGHFGRLAAGNARLVERLKSDTRRGKGRVWPETEAQIRAFVLARRAAERGQPIRKQRSAA